MVVVNESLAEKLFPGEDAVGRRIASAQEPGRSGEIVGVVEDVWDDRLLGGPGLQLYLPFAQNPKVAFTFVVRTTGSPSVLEATARRAILEVDRTIAIGAARPLSALVAGTIARERYAMWQFGVFAGIALVLATTGLYGVMVYSVSQRRNEIGVRMALGARQSGVLRLVLGEGARLVALGLGIGLVATVVLSRFLSSLLHGLSATDPWTIAAAGALLAVVGGLACFLPAVQAARVHPASALRSE